MSSLVHAPSTVPSTVTDTATNILSAPTTIAAGQTAYATYLPDRTGTPYYLTGQILYYTASSSATITNYGTIWVRLTDDNTLDFGSFLVKATATVGTLTSPTIANHGLAVLDNRTGLTYAFAISGTLTNTGQIYALSASNGSAWGVFSESSWSKVNNSGLIAAYAGTGLAAGVELENGGSLINQATGLILAEGANARAVWFGRGTYLPRDDTPEISNAGLIQASSLDASRPAVAVYVSHLEPEQMRIVNSGTIRGDYAIYANSYTTSPPSKGKEVITNEATGRIEGTVFLDQGDDQLTNKGTLTGDVSLGYGKDLFDTQLGSWTGLASLGFGNDTFLGSAGNDVVLGEWDDDWIEGNAGQDLLLGDRGNDTLIGGTGSDGLYGSFGADLIVTQGSDYVLAGTGSDRIELGDYTFAKVDGEFGIDTLVLPNSNKVLDLSAARVGERIAHIEHIVLPGAQELVVRSADVAALTDSGVELCVSAGPIGRITLVGDWIAIGDRVIDYAIYRGFILDGKRVLVRAGAILSIVAEAPSTASGLDAIADGAAPLPGSVAGTDLPGYITLADDFEYLESITIDADEIWTSENGGGILTTWDVNFPALTNNGAIVSETVQGTFDWTEAIRTLQVNLRYSDHYKGTATGLGATAIEPINGGLITNNGLIGAFSHGEGYAVTVFVGASGKIINQGQVEASADSVATAIATWDGLGGVDNAGEIRATSANSLGIGIFLANRTHIVNSGTIEVTGATEAIGMLASSGFTFTNSGTLVAQTSGQNGGRSFAISSYNNDPHTINNTGTIQADVIVNYYGDAHYGSLNVNNSGTIKGKLSGDSGYDRVANSGTIYSDLYLGQGNDILDGATGKVVGSIYGEDGNDKLLAGIGDDSLSGGNGDDTLSGGAGLDTLIGGLGNDTYIIDGDGDVIVENAGEGVDTIQANFTYALADIFENLTLSGAANIDGTGNAGDNVLIGNVGINILNGGAGNDTYHVGIGDTIVEKAGGGTDTVVADGSWTLGDFIENLTLSGSANFNGTGNALNNVITGNSGANTLSGNGGVDTLIGGAGNDIYFVDSADEIITENASEGTDTVNASITYTLSANVENLTLIGIASINGTGNSSNNLIIGNDAANSISGAAGNDTLEGGAGNDTMAGGAGNDTYRIDSANDLIIENSGDGTDVVYSAVSIMLSANVEHLTLTGAANIDATGNLGNNLLTGNAGKNVLAGGGGNDTLDGGSGFDIAYFNGPFSNYTVRSEYSGRTVVDKTGVEGTDTLIGIERLQFENTALAFETNGTAGKAYRLYQAAFNRTPDIAGLGWQIKALDSGVSLLQVSQNFMDSAEFTSLYGANISNASLVKQLYNNILHRTPQQFEVNFWANILQTSQQTRNEVLMNFSESPENQAQVIGSIYNGIAYTVFG